MDKTSIFMFEILEPGGGGGGGGGGQLWANTAFEGCQFYSIGVPKFYSWVNVISVYPGGQLWANTAFEGSQFYSIWESKFYSWVNVISVYAYNDLG